MKILTALMITLASLSMVHAAEPETSEVVVQMPGTKEISVVLADDKMPAEGECKAVCMLPGLFD